MSEQIIKIAQVDNPIINNLVNTENKLDELNQEVNVILSDYNYAKPTETSFFNFNNPFFLLTLLGLFLLVFALLFLRKELKYEQNKHKLNIIRKEEAEIREKDKVIKEAIKVDKKLKVNKAKVRKIKVVKVK